MLASYLAMPELFPSLTIFVLSSLIMVGAQLIYAAVGFGAGMFSITLLAMLLPDLAGAVTTLFVLTLVTELCVLSRTWRDGNLRVLLGLLPTSALGLWLGSLVLVTGDVSWLKRLLGALIVGSGVWFLLVEKARGRASGQDPGDPSAMGDHTTPLSLQRGSVWLSLPVGLASGTLAGLFGMGGPPVIMFLKKYRLDKGAFRATILWYFLILSVFRGPIYAQAGILTVRELHAALWLLPASLLGMVLGMTSHRRMSEWHFGTAVSILLIILGTLLTVAG